MTSWLQGYVILRPDLADLIDGMTPGRSPPTLPRNASRHGGLGGGPLVLPLTLIPKPSNCVTPSDRLRGQFACTEGTPSYLGLNPHGKIHVVVYREEHHD